MIEIINHDSITKLLKWSYKGKVNYNVFTVIVLLDISII